MKKLVALDLDGTLLNSSHKISKANYDTLKNLAERGVIISLASGRMYKSMRPFIDELGLGTNTIAYNGAMIVDANGNILYEDQLSVDFTKELIKYCAENDLHLNYYVNDDLFTLKDDKWLKLYGDRTGMYANIVKDFPIEKAPTKMLIIDEPEKITGLYNELSKKYGDHAYVTISNIEYLEFMPIMANKGAALEKLADIYGVSQNDTIFFGDASNDISAVKWAGAGVAMENGCEPIKEIADIIAPDADLDGVSILLNDIFADLLKS